MEFFFFRFFTRYRVKSDAFRRKFDLSRTNSDETLYFINGSCFGKKSTGDRTMRYDTKPDFAVARGCLMNVLKNNKTLVTHKATRYQSQNYRKRVIIELLPRRHWFVDESFPEYRSHDAFIIVIVMVSVIMLFTLYHVGILNLWYRPPYRVDFKRIF